MQKSKVMKNDYYNQVLGIDEDFKCKQVDHNGERIQFVCVYPSCSSNARLGCSYCKFTQHLNHLQSVIYLKQFNEHAVNESEAVKRKLEQLILKGGAANPLPSNLKSRVINSMDECVQRFNRIITAAQDNLFRAINEFSLNDARENPTINVRITEFKQRLFKTIQKTWKSLTPNEIDFLVSFYNQSYEKSDYFIAEPNIKDIKSKIDNFLEKINCNIEKLNNELNNSLKEINESSGLRGNSGETHREALLQEIYRKEIVDPPIHNFQKSQFMLPALKTLEKPKKNYSTHYGRSTPFKKGRKDAYNPVYNPMLYTQQNQEYDIPQPIPVPRESMLAASNPQPYFNGQAQKSYLRDSRNSSRQRDGGKNPYNRMRNSSLGHPGSSATPPMGHQYTGGASNGTPITTKQKVNNFYSLQKSENSAPNAPAPQQENRRRVDDNRNSFQKQEAPPVMRVNKSFELSPGRRGQYMPLNTEPSPLMNQTTYNSPSNNQNGMANGGRQNVVPLSSLTNGFAPQGNQVQTSQNFPSVRRNSGDVPREYNNQSTRDYNNQSSNYENERDSLEIQIRQFSQTLGAKNGDAYRSLNTDEMPDNGYKHQAAPVRNQYSTLDTEGSGNYKEGTPTKTKQKVLYQDSSSFGGMGNRYPYKTSTNY